ncbi:DNA repair protein RAD57 [Annulohypoxylon maeteangense]|uniref:DNA repair protein RAD57 n=1 Tax=Annulohypoxylon maeteangense TaxID=1927788 RepID=UPI00200803B8|nr:DNA repair protein RAD57 [Annulohypoxylon maeteangense]KAI0884693.1 DNA repair protein RAD57 [Annulohypoxylon maeteangense]
MTDLLRILPDFPTARYANLLPTIEREGLTTADLLTLQVPDIGKRTQLPLLDIKRLCAAVLEALHVDLGVSDKQQQKQPKDDNGGKGAEKATSPGALKRTGTELLAEPTRYISTLDPDLDLALGGGVPAGYITEITGESGAGKTQFLLTLLLAVQLPPPHGLGRPALYISTEAPLSTRRLSQLLSHNPFFQSLPASSKPTLDNIIGTVTPDLESQDHILTFQVPVEVARRNIGLLILDSVAANFRAEYDRGASSSANLAARSTALLNLGLHLHELARKHNLAVVVANQVADRFSGSSFKGSSAAQPFSLPRVSQESPLAKRSKGGLGTPVHLSGWSVDPPSSGTADLVRSSMPEPTPEEAPAPPALLLDHQQRWFTGWGDAYPYPYSSSHYGSSEQNLKTPSLGLVWSTQIAARVALWKRPVYGRKEVLDDGEGESTTTLRNWRRWMKVVFAPHVAGSGPGLDGAVEFEVTMGGVRGVDKDKGKRGKGKRKGNEEEEEEE